MDIARCFDHDVILRRQLGGERCQLRLSTKSEFCTQWRLPRFNLGGDPTRQDDWDPGRTLSGGGVD
jgi:hypothetical protein